MLQPLCSFNFPAALCPSVLYRVSHSNALNMTHCNTFSKKNCILVKRTNALYPYCAKNKNNSSLFTYFSIHIIKKNPYYIKPPLLYVYFSESVFPYGFSIGSCSTYTHLSRKTPYTCFAVYFYSC